MVPLKCEDVRVRGLPLATMALIAACIAFYVRSMQRTEVLEGFVPLNFAHALFHPSEAGAGAVAALAGAMFLHAGPLHLLSNMWYLWIFGSAVEQRVGAVKFVAFYFVCGVLSMLVQALSDPLSGIPIVGASGAIAGIMGFHLVLAPLSRLLVWFPPIFFFPVPAFIFLGLWLFLQYVNLRGAASGAPGVAWWAHIGGYVSGSLLALFVRPWGAQGKRASGRGKRGS